MLPMQLLLRAWARDRCGIFAAPKDEHFFHHLLRISGRQGNANAVSALLHQALWHFPQSPLLHLRHTLSALHQGYDAVPPLHAAQRYAESHGMDVSVLYRAEAYCTIGRLEEAQKLVADVIETQEQGFSEGQGSSGRLTPGLLPDLWASAAAMPDDAGVFKKLWFYSELHQDFEESLERYRQVLEEHPYCCFAWFNLGLTLAALGRWTEALDALEYAYLTDPGYAEAYRERAELAIRHEQWGLGLETCRAYTEKAGYQSDMLLLESVCLDRLDRREEARLACLLALQQAPQNAEAWYRLGVMAADEALWKEAGRHFRHALRIDKGHAGCHAALADVLEQQGKVRQAYSHAWKAIGLAPEEAAYWRRLSEIMWRAGRRSDALEVIDQGLMHSDGADLLYSRAVCLFGLGRRTSALRQLRQALRSDYRRHTVLFEWQPALQEDQGVQTLLSGFRDRANSL
jgi:tetratricopeptide (TPR) repeat protein